MHSFMRGLFELATKLAEQLEEAGLQDVSELRAEWANDTIYTYPLLFGSRHHDCHGFALKIYVAWLMSVGNNNSQLVI